MSVGAVSNIYAGVPGLATLGLGVTPPASTTSTTPPATTNPPPKPPPPNPYAGIPGAASLGLTAPAGTTGSSSGSSVAGFTVLGIQGNGKPTTPPPSTTTPNVYQQAYNGITAAANNYLQSSLGQGPSTIPLYAGGTTANAFASLNNTLAALKTGLAAGLFQGTGFNALA